MITVKQFCKEFKITERQFYGLDEYDIGCDSEFDQFNIDLDIPDNFSLHCKGTIKISEHVNIYGKFTPTCAKLIIKGSNSCLYACTEFNPVTLSDLVLPKITRLPENIGIVDWRTGINAPNLDYLPRKFRIKHPNKLIKLQLGISRIKKSQFDNLFQAKKSYVGLNNLQRLPRGVNLITNDLYMNSLYVLNNTTIICNSFNVEQNKLNRIDVFGKVNILAGTFGFPFPKFIKSPNAELNIYNAYETDKFGSIYETDPKSRDEDDSTVRFSKSIINYEKERFLTCEDNLYKLHTVRQIDSKHKVAYVAMYCPKTYLPSLVDQDFYILIKDDDLDCSVRGSEFKTLMAEHYPIKDDE